MYLFKMSLEAVNTVITHVFTPFSPALNSHKSPFLLMDNTIMRNNLPVCQVLDFTKWTFHFAFRNFIISVPDIYRSFSHDVMLDAMLVSSTVWS